MNCSTPKKVLYKTKEAAEAGMLAKEQRWGVDKSLRPYPCYGHWHLGHTSQRAGNLNARIAFALGKRRRRRR